MAALDWSAAELPARVERLANGMTVIVHAESKSPIAAVYVGYRAGSRDEPPSKAGLAHLCEHLMFSGTRGHPGSYFEPFEAIGASSMNAYVREDYSAYFETVPVGSLDFALTMEADRMANIAEALDDARIERQRDVVINELRQRESQPYGCSTRILAELGHPPNHPYAHVPDGLVEELGNISANDVRAWLETRHCPSMATLIIVGQVEPEPVIAKAEDHFGSLAQKPTAPSRAFAGTDSGLALRYMIELPVPNDKICIAWRGPSSDSPEYPALEAACEWLAGSRNSRLWHRLVQAERLATAVEVQLRPRELGVLIVVGATARIGAPLSTIEKVVRTEIEQLIVHGPTPQELDIARLRILGKMLRGFERAGGPHSKSDALGFASIVGGGVDSHRRRLSTFSTLNPNETADAARWLAGAGAVLEMHRLGDSNGSS